jgi:hypothetical protein
MNPFQSPDNSSIPDGAPFPQKPFRLASLAEQLKLVASSGPNAEAFPEQLC